LTISGTTRESSHLCIGGRGGCGFCVRLPAESTDQYELVSRFPQPPAPALPCGAGMESTLRPAPASEKEMRESWCSSLSGEGLANSLSGGEQYDYALLNSWKSFAAIAVFAAIVGFATRTLAHSDSALETGPDIRCGN